MTKRHAKPTSAKKRKPPTTAQVVGRIPKWLAGFEERMVNQAALLRLDTEKNARLLNTLFFDSKAAREDNLPTLPALLRAIERESQGSAHLRVTARTLTDHCARLLKEKETLQKQIEKMREPFKIVPGEPVYNVEITPVEVKMGTYTYTGVLGGACTIAHLHRPGIRCGVCGETPA
jgi:hypothetical protein